jgi:hypothetical protein
MPETYQLMPTLLGTPVSCWLYKTGTAATHYPNHPNITGDRFITYTHSNNIINSSIIILKKYNLAEDGHSLMV